MKTGWHKTTLGAVAQVGAGNSAPQGDTLFAEGIYPFFRTSDAGRVRFGDIAESSDYLNNEGIKGLRLLPAGTILFPKSGASTFLNHRVMMAVDGYVSSHLATIVGDEAKVDRRFLLYFLSTVSAQDLVQDHAYPSLNLPLISGIPVLLPPLPKQHHIVAILDEAFDGIATAKTNAEKNLQNARALFESHLQSVFTERGEGWVNITLDKATGGVFTGPFGSLLHKSDYVTGGIPLVNPAHITATGIKPDNKKTVSKETAQRLSSYIMRDGDIVIGRRGEMGRCALITDVEDGWLCGTGSFFIKPSERCNPCYLVRFLRSDTCKQKLEKIAGGAVMPNLSNTDLGNLSINLPPPEQQKTIVGEIEAVAEETQRLESIYQKKLTALEDLKKSLLHQAFSGAL